MSLSKEDVRLIVKKFSTLGATDQLIAVSALHEQIAELGIDLWDDLIAAVTPVANTYPPMGSHQLSHLFGGLVELDAGFVNKLLPLFESNDQAVRRLVYTAVGCSWDACPDVLRAKIRERFLSGDEDGCEKTLPQMVVSLGRILCFEALPKLRALKESGPSGDGVQSKIGEAIEMLEKPRKDRKIPSIRGFPGKGTELHNEVARILAALRQ